MNVRGVTILAGLAAGAGFVIGIVFFAASVTAQDGADEQADIPLLINGGDGVLNGSFEYWLDGVPLYWELLEEQFEQGRSGARHGSSLLQLGPGYVYTIAEQVVHATGPLGGRTLELSAYAWTQEERTVRMALTLSEDLPKEYSEWHPGDGRWHRLTATLTLAEGDSSTSCIVQLAHSGRPARFARYDDVTIRVR